MVVEGRGVADWVVVGDSKGGTGVEVAKGCAVVGDAVGDGGSVDAFAEAAVGAAVGAIALGRQAAIRLARVPRARPTKVRRETGGPGFSLLSADGSFSFASLVKCLRFCTGVPSG